MAAKRAAAERLCRARRPLGIFDVTLKRILQTQFFSSRSGSWNNSVREHCTHRAGDCTVAVYICHGP